MSTDDNAKQATSRKYERPRFRVLRPKLGSHITTTISSASPRCAAGEAPLASRDKLQQ